MTIIYGVGADTITWEEARAKVRTDLWRTSSVGLPDDVLDRALHAALRRLEAERRWLWLDEVRADIIMDVQADRLALPGVKSITSIGWYSGENGRYQRIDAASLSFIREAARDYSSASRPSYYCFTGNVLYFDCPVQAGDKFEIICKAGTPGDLTTAMNNPPLTLTMQQSAVVAAACAHIALSFLKNDAEAARQEATYQGLLATITDEEDEARGDVFGPGIVPDVSYHRAAFGGR